MAANVNLLIPEFKTKAEQLIENCKKQNIIMIPCETLRTPFLQATYWRQSRSNVEINEVTAMLKENSAEFLAYCIESVVQQQGPHITNALPGFSWHQWGEAIDCYWLVNGKRIYDLNLMINGRNGYEVYASEAKKMNLNAGYFWTIIKDATHVQYQKYDSPSGLYSLQEINAIMEKTYPH